MNKHSWIQSVADVMTVTDNMPCDPASDHNYIFSPFRKVYLTWRPRLVSMVMLQCCKEDIPQFETLHFLGTNNMGSPYFNDKKLCLEDIHCWQKPYFYSYWLLELWRYYKIISSLILDCICHDRRQKWLAWWHIKIYLKLLGWYNWCIDTVYCLSTESH